MVDFFRESGVPDDRILYLQDREATLDAIRESFPDFFIIDGSQEWLRRDRIGVYEPEMYPIGSAVEVQDEEEQWYRSTVKKAWYGLHYISYDDYDEIWDEWVGGDRLRDIA